ncbi:uncharacterized protein LOC125047937 [Penaeus chinensis]|uniref:uncharacterized protein LOC125047937 n=1 Tax=Penaeus chinensis TaxID=139456 RepID=UPI001FB7A03B|nr:uncharacterized protein LOC125047937 [Penaeus chinensis]
MTLLRELFDGEVKEPETRSSYEYVINLRERLEDTCPAVVVVNDEDNTEGRATTIPSYKQRETWRDVSLDSDLPADHQNDARGILQAFGDVLTDVPGKTTELEYNIELTVPEIIRVKPYPLPYRLEEDVKNELRSMLEIGIIEPSDSDYSTPILVVPKKDGNRRLC